MLRAPRLAVLLTLPVLALSACGGDDPAAALKTSGEALAKVPGFHLEGTQTDKDGDATLSGDVRADGSFDLTIANATQGTIELRLVGGQAYLNADETFWTSNGGAQAASAFAGKWVKGPADQLGGADFQQFLPKNLGYCLSKDTGKLSDGGTGDVDGKAVKIIKGAGDEPGTSPGELSIASDGEPLPLRFMQTGPSKPGGAKDARCGDTGEADTTQKSDVKLSDFTASSKIEAPADAIDLATAAGA